MLLKHIPISLLGHFAAPPPIPLPLAPHSSNLDDIPTLNPEERGPRYAAFPAATFWGCHQVDLNYPPHCQYIPFSCFTGRGKGHPELWSDQPVSPVLGSRRPDLTKEARAVRHWCSVNIPLHRWPLTLGGQPRGNAPRKQAGDWLVLPLWDTPSALL